jgi:hypothetical protein
MQNGEKLTSAEDCEIMPMSLMQKTSSLAIRGKGKEKLRAMI